MIDGNAPDAPDSLPKYLGEGLPKQNLETLHDVSEFVEELIEHKQRPIASEDLPEGAEPVETDDSDESGSKGTVVKEMVTCGDETCHCSDGELHGPYLYRYYRDDSGTVVSEYVGKPN